MRFLVSAGPTHEYLDDVRYLGNPSTGAMGIAVAEAAREAGHEVELVLGPSALSDPRGVAVTRVVSAVEMHESILARASGADAIVMTAAVADYRPARRAPGKIKKGAAAISLELVKNPDILAELGTMPADRVLVGFALEAAPPDEALALAREKLTRKRCDLIVLNRKGSLGGDRGEDVVLVLPDGSTIPLGNPEKRTLAARLVRWCEHEVGKRRDAGRERQQDEAGRSGPAAAGPGGGRPPSGR